MRKSYVLLINCKRDALIGTKGRKFFIAKGIYAYVGSCGKFCAKRIERHLIMTKKRYYWHIDFLMVQCDPIAVLVLQEEEKCLALLLSKTNSYIKKF